MENQPREFEGRLAPGRDWREIVAWVGDLAPMPQVASKALQLVENPDATAQELSDLLSTDPALATRVLKIANSALFSRQREITTISQAVMMIGLKALKGIVVAAVLKQLNKSQSIMERMVWEASMAGAFAASQVAKKLRRKYLDEIFLLGLLHNLGQFVLLTKPETAKDYDKVLEEIQGNGKDFVSAEQTVFGFSHSLIGALVCKKWNFPPEVCQVILHYKDSWSEEKPGNEQEDKSAILSAGELLLRITGLGTPPNYPDQSENLTKLLQTLGLDSAQIPSIIDELKQTLTDQFNAERSVFE
jgi:HD-like signal output (HDOD) protein